MADGDMTSGEGTPSLRAVSCRMSSHPVMVANNYLSERASIVTKRRSFVAGSFIGRGFA